MCVRFAKAGEKETHKSHFNPNVVTTMGLQHVGMVVEGSETISISVNIKNQQQFYQIDVLNRTFAATCDTIPYIAINVNHTVATVQCLHSVQCTHIYYDCLFHCVYLILGSLFVLNRSVYLSLFAISKMTCGNCQRLAFGYAYSIYNVKENNVHSHNFSQQKETYKLIPFDNFLLNFE